MSTRDRRTGLSLALALAALTPFATLPASRAHAAPEGTAPEAAAVHALRLASGGSATIRVARESGLVVSLVTPRGREIPVAGESAAERARAFLDAHGAALGLNGRRDLRLLAQQEDELGLVHVRYQQHNGGVPIRGAQVIVHLSAGGVRAVNAKSALDLGSLVTTPGVSAEAAAETARAFVSQLEEAVDLECGSPRLEIVDPRLVGGPLKAARLTWLVEVQGERLRRFVSVDAHENRVVVHSVAGSREGAAVGTPPIDVLSSRVRDSLALMAEGGGESGAISGISPEKTAAIAKRALAVNLLDEASIADANDALGQSCQDLIGTLGITAADCGRMQKALSVPPAAEPPLCPAGQTVSSAFFDDLEDRDSGNWVPESLAGASDSAWELSDEVEGIYHYYPGSYSGTTSFLAINPVDKLDSVVMMTRDISVPAAARLHFKHLEEFLMGVSGTVVEYSLDAGATWQDALPLYLSGANYAATPLSGDADNTLAGRRAFSETLSAWTGSQYDLSSLAGRQVRFRFRFATSSSPSQYSWWRLDDLRVYACEPSGSGDVVAMQSATAIVPEGGWLLGLTVERSGDLAEGVTVSYATSDGTATAGSDYTSTSGTLTFVADQASQTILIPLLDDYATESNEVFQVRLTGVSGASAVLGAPSSTAITILDNDPASWIALASGSLSVPEGAGRALVNVRRTGALRGQAKVDYRVVEGTASAGSDYVLTSGTLTFAGGVGLRTFAVPITNDTMNEGDETVLIQLEKPVSAGLGPRDTAVLTIRDDDRGGSLRFQAATQRVREGETTLRVVVLRRGGLAGPLTVGYASTGGSATAGADYDTASGTLTFAAGQVVQSFPLTLHGDDQAEGSETIELALSSPTGGATLATPSAMTIVITDDEPVVELAAAAYSVVEGSLAVINVVRQGNPRGPVTVEYRASDGTASAPGDYAARSGTLTLPAGATQRSFLVPTVNDTVDESDESVQITLAGTTGATLGRQSAATLTIKDNDSGGVLQFAQSTYVVSEAALLARIVVSRTGGVASDVSVECLVSGGTAMAGSDYVSPDPNPIVLAFVRGQSVATILLPIANDTEAEGSETIAVALQNPTGGATLGSRSAASVVVNDNDAPVFRFASASPVAGELARRAVIVVQRVGDAREPASVVYTATAGSATEGEDFRATSGRLTFARGATTQSFVVPIVDDALDEPVETIDLALASPSSGTYLGHPSRATLSIIDSDLPGRIAFEAPVYSAFEGEVHVSVTVRRAGGTAAPATVRYATSDGTATAGADYVAANGLLAFAPGEVAQAITLTLIDDDEGEAAESLTLTLSEPSVGSIIEGQPTATLWILDDEAPAAIQFTSISPRARETSGAGTFTLRRTGRLSGTASARYRTSPESATAGADYVAVSGTVTFLPLQSEQTLVVPLIDDAVSEDVESFVVTLSAPGPGAVLGPRAQARGFILDDESASDVCTDGYCAANEDFSSCPQDCDHDLVVVVGQALARSLQARLDQYLADVSAEGRRARVEVFAGGTAADLKDLIYDQVDRFDVEGALLLGDLPAAWYEQTAFGTDEQFPIDLYFQDRDAVWGDVDGDGRLDSHSDLSLDIFTSRLTGAVLDLQDYFDRVHRYRTEGPLVTPSAFNFIDNDWASWAGTYGLENIYKKVDVLSDPAQTTRANYIAKLTGDGAEFVYQWIHSYPGGLYVSGTGGGWIDLSDIVRNNFKASFLNLFDCSAARFTESNLAMTYALRTDYGLAFIGSTKTGGIYTPEIFHSQLAAGMTWGESFRQWYTGNGKYNDEWYLGIIIGGDPLLTVSREVGAPVGAMSARHWKGADLARLRQTMVRIALQAKLGTYESYRKKNPQFFGD